MKKKLLLIGAALMMMAALAACGDDSSGDRGGSGGKASLFEKSAPQDLDEVDYDGDLNGLKVSGTIYYIYDWYCETTDEKDRQVSREYIIDAGDDYYMGMLVEAVDMDDPEDLMAACWEYEDNLDTGVEDDGTGVYRAQYKVTGTIKKMPSDSQEYYYQYLSECGLSAEDQKAFLPYYLVVE